jgi:hypothetical protein
MTPFVCHVTGANANASPVDIDYAILPRRCLDPTNCNFGPRQPLYWLELGYQINMPETLNSGRTKLFSMASANALKRIFWSTLTNIAMLL